MRYISFLCHVSECRAEKMVTSCVGLLQILNMCHIQIGQSSMTEDDEDVTHPENFEDGVAEDLGRRVEEAPVVDASKKSLVNSDDLVQVIARLEFRFQFQLCRV